MIPMAHNFNDPRLPALISETIELWDKLTGKLAEIQQITGIPAFHTDVNSDDDSPGVLERIQFMQESQETSLDAFKAYDDETTT
jgi:hypothetical protein